ncbi:MAG: molybdopterin-binding protein, partial [Candidatus Bathyarchaeia archaeon]
MSFSTEILCVGNELLIGKTLDTNANWLAKRITELGGSVKRITIVSDEIEEISSVIKDSLKRKPDLMITSGGLGPTHDDKTLEGVSKAIKKRLRLNKKALGYIKARYARIDPKIELTKPRIKMATLPSGAKPILNPVGTAPGVLIKHGITYILCLPGVPEELKAIFNQFIPEFIKKLPKSYFFEEGILLHGIIESELSKFIDEVMKRNPGVYIKSHPKVIEDRNPLIELHFSSFGKDLDEIRKKVVDSIADIIAQL